MRRKEANQKADSGSNNSYCKIKGSKDQLFSRERQKATLSVRSDKSLNGSGKQKISVSTIEPSDTAHNMRTDTSPSNFSFTQESKITIKELCPEEKKKIGDLVRRLAQEKKSNEQMQNKFEKDNEDLRSSLSNLTMHNNLLTKESDVLRDKLQESLSILTELKSQTKRSPLHNNRSMSVDVGVSPVQIPKQLPSWTEALDQKIISLSPSPNPNMSEELEFERAEVERQVDEKKYSEERNIPMISESPMTERADQPHNALQEITQLRSEMVGLSQLLKSLNFTPGKDAFGQLIQKSPLLTPLTEQKESSPMTVTSKQPQGSRAEPEFATSHSSIIAEEEKESTNKESIYPTFRKLGFETTGNIQLLRDREGDRGIEISTEYESQSVLSAPHLRALKGSIDPQEIGELTLEELVTVRESLIKDIEIANSMVEQKITQKLQTVNEHEMSFRGTNPLLLNSDKQFSPTLRKFNQINLKNQTQKSHQCGEALPRIEESPTESYKTDNERHEQFMEDHKQINLKTSTHFDEKLKMFQEIKSRMQEKKLNENPKEYKSKLKRMLKKAARSSSKAREKIKNQLQILKEEKSKNAGIMSNGSRFSIKDRGRKRSISPNSWEYEEETSDTESVTEQQARSIQQEINRMSINSAEDISNPQIYVGAKPYHYNNTQKTSIPQDEMRIKPDILHKHVHSEVYGTDEYSKYSSGYPRRYNVGRHSEIPVCWEGIQRISPGVMVEDEVVELASTLNSQETKGEEMQNFYDESLFNLIDEIENIPPNLPPNIRVSHLASTQSAQSYGGGPGAHMMNPHPHTHSQHIMGSASSIPYTLSPVKSVSGFSTNRLYEDFPKSNLKYLYSGMGDGSAAGSIFSITHTTSGELTAAKTVGGTSGGKYSGLNTTSHSKGKSTLQTALSTDRHNLQSITKMLGYDSQPTINNLGGAPRHKVYYPAPHPY